MIRWFLLISLGLATLLASCTQKSPYEQLVQRELASGERNDSLFLGYHFRMSTQEFFEHSWALNRQKKVMQGEGSASVRYEVRDLEHKAHMEFYPAFHEGRLYRMPVTYMYDGWAPWNRNLWADSLKMELIDHFAGSKGVEFIETTHPERDVPAHIAVEGNRRIAIYELNDREVMVDYADLSVLKELKPVEGK